MDWYSKKLIFYSYNTYPSSMDFEPYNSFLLPTNAAGIVGGLYAIVASVLIIHLVKKINRHDKLNETGNNYGIAILVPVCLYFVCTFISYFIYMILCENQNIAFIRNIVVSLLLIELIGGPLLAYWIYLGITGDDTIKCNNERDKELKNINDDVKIAEIRLRYAIKIEDSIYTTMAVMLGLYPVSYILITAINYIIAGVLYGLYRVPLIPAIIGGFVLLVRYI
jgi:hypothetical protein